MYCTSLRAAARPLIISLASSLACAWSVVQAAVPTAPPPATTPGTAATTKSAPAPAKPASGTARSAPIKRAIKPVVPPAPVEVPLPDADGVQAAAASMILFGHYDCEFSQNVEVMMNPKHEGYIDVAFGKQKWTMKPVLSSTGALRLEDVRGQALMLQIAHKSMVMDVIAGRRMVDECVHEKQAAAKKAAEGQEAPGLMDK